MGLEGRGLEDIDLCPQYYQSQDGRRSWAEEVYSDRKGLRNRVGGSLRMGVDAAVVQVGRGRAGGEQEVDNRREEDRGGEGRALYRAGEKRRFP